MTIIVGLGNPGTSYRTSRHNVGFVMVDALAGQWHAETFHMEKKYNAEIATLTHQGEKILLVKPQTYMNNSGVSVRALMRYYALLPKQLGILTKKNADVSDALIVIHDDIDLPLGTYKLQKNRSAGGHNGVGSIIQHLKTQNFTRVRIGVATPLLRTRVPAEKFVLQPFTKQELVTLQDAMPTIMNAIEQASKQALK